MSRTYRFQEPVKVKIEPHWSYFREDHFIHESIYMAVHTGANFEPHEHELKDISSPTVMEDGCIFRFAVREPERYIELS